MASAARSLRLVCRSGRNQRPTQHVGPKVFVAWKSVSGGSFKEVRLADAGESKPTPFDHWEEEGAEQERKYRNMNPLDIARSLASEEVDDVRTLNQIGYDIPSLNKDETMKTLEDVRQVTRPLRAVMLPKRDAFWDDEEPDNDLITNDDNDAFDENDMTDIAHAKLEEHREQREYARIAIWEMPLLASECCLHSGEGEGRNIGRLRG